MWPWGHLAVGYLLYVGLSRVHDPTGQTVPTLLALVFGTQVPDLVDKPLAWTLEVLPSGRSLGHSLLIQACLLVVLYGAVSEKRKPVVAALGIGSVSHSLSDLGPEVVGGLLLGDGSQLQWTSYLVWPVLGSPSYPEDNSFVTHFAQFEVSPYVAFQFGLCALALGVWVYSDGPGPRAITRWLRSKVSPTATG